MTPKMGRPKSENPKNIRLEIRLNKDEADLLEECARLLDASRTDVIVKGIQMVKDEINKK